MAGKLVRWLLRLLQGSAKTRRFVVESLTQPLTAGRERRARDTSVHERVG